MNEKLLRVLLCFVGIGDAQGAESKPSLRPVSCPPVLTKHLDRHGYTKLDSYSSFRVSGLTFSEKTQFPLDDPKNTQIFKLMMECQGLQKTIQKKLTSEHQQKGDTSAVRLIQTDGTLLSSISERLHQLEYGLMGLWQSAMVGSVQAMDSTSQNLPSAPFPMEARWFQNDIARLIQVEGESIRAEMAGMLVSGMQGTRFYNTPEVVQNQELCERIARCALGKNEQQEDVLDRLEELAKSQKKSWWRHAPKRSISQVGFVPLRPTSPSLSSLSEYQRDGITIALAKLHPTPVFPPEVTEDTVEQYLKETMDKLGKSIKAELISQARACAILELSKAFENSETCEAILSTGLGTDTYARLVALAGGIKRESIQ